MPAASSYSALNTFTDFGRIVDPTVFASVPDDSLIAVADIVDSTGAIAAGRYKDVNMAGAAVISAAMNAIGHREFPFVFGGDGATLVLEPRDAPAAAGAMTATAAWARRELGLGMRVAMVPVAAARAAGHDVRVARYAPSPAVDYAILSGGGIEWAEQRMKAGAYALPPGPPDAVPDLTGLTCRWQPMASRYGTILSIIARPAPGGQRGAFAAAVRMLLDLVAADAHAGHPVPPDGPTTRWPPKGLGLEVSATHGRGSKLVRRVYLLGHSLFAWLIFHRNRPIGRFDPSHYRRQLFLNADYRKYDDGLRMTVDCRTATADRIEALLAGAARDGTVRYGTHRQAAAQMTCIVPSSARDDHFHFIDGAGGGYAAAALKLKRPDGA